MSPESGFIKSMQAVANSSDRKDNDKLVSIVKESAKRTKQEINANAVQRVKLDNLMKLQDAVDDNAEKYLLDSMKTLDEFSEMVTPRSQVVSGALRVFSLGIYQPKVLTLHDLTEMIIQLYSEQKNHAELMKITGLLIGRQRDFAYALADRAKKELEGDDYCRTLIQPQIKKLEALDLAVKNSIQGKEVTLEQLKYHLEICRDAKIFDGTRIIEEINAGKYVKEDLYGIVTDLNVAQTELRREYMSRTVSSSTLSSMTGAMEISKLQFDMIIDVSANQLKQLEYELLVTRRLAKEIFHFAQNGDERVDAQTLDSFVKYKTEMNNVQRFNTLGGAIVLDKCTFTAVNPPLNNEALEETKSELQQAKQMFAVNDKKFDKANEKMSGAVLKEQYTPLKQ